MTNSNKVNTILQIVDEANPIKLEYFRQLEAEFCKERNINYPFTELSAFVRTEVKIGTDFVESEASFLQHIRSCFSNTRTFFDRDDDIDPILETLTTEELSVYSDQMYGVLTEKSINNNGVALDLWLSLPNKTIVSDTINGLLENNYATKVDFLNKVITAQLDGDFIPLLFSVLNKIAKDLPLDFLDLILRISPGMCPGTYNYFLFSALFKLTHRQQMESDKYGELVNGLNFYKQLLISGNVPEMPQVQEIISSVVYQEKVLTAVLDVTELYFCAYNALSI
jgi:hypothetical protein